MTTTFSANKQSPGLNLFRTIDWAAGIIEDSVAKPCSAALQTVAESCISAFDDSVAKPCIRAIETVAKPCICVIGSLFQAAKTLIKLPFTAIVMPFAFILEKVAEFQESDELKKTAEAISFGFSKDLIMTIHLAHFTFSDARDKQSLEEVLQLNFEVVAGTEVSYEDTADNLWARYLYGKAPGDNKKKCSSLKSTQKAAPIEQVLQAQKPHVNKSNLTHTLSNDEPVAVVKGRALFAQFLAKKKSPLSS